MTPASRIQVFYDGDSRFLVREMQLLKKMDRKDRICFSNIAARNFDARIFEKTQRDLMADVHGLLPDGTWLRGPEVFRCLYAAVGLRPLVWLTRIPVLKQLLDAAYRIFARHRLQQSQRTREDYPVRTSNAAG